MTELSVLDLEFHYRTRRGPVFSGLDLTCGSGRTVLLGPNGAGKSTLMALMASALRPKGGTIELRIGGGGVTPWGSQAYRQGVGWMPQDVSRIPGLTVGEQVAYHAWLKGMSIRAGTRALEDAVEAVNLGPLRERKTHTLSGGQARRMGLAQALVTKPEVLLLDEPTAGLDPAQRRNFRDILRSLDPNICLLVSTHQIDDIQALFDRVLVMARGQIQFVGSVDAFLDHSPTGDWSGAELAYANLVGGTES